MTTSENLFIRWEIQQERLNGNDNRVRELVRSRDATIRRNSPKKRVSSDTSRFSPRRASRDRAEAAASESQSPGLELVEVV
jgi:hypothetical protein